MSAKTYDNWLTYFKVIGKKSGHFETCRSEGDALGTHNSWNYIRCKLGVEEDLEEDDLRQRRLDGVNEHQHSSRKSKI